MPNRKTFDEREKVDHSSHRTSGTEKGDLAPVPNSDDDGQPGKNPGDSANAPPSNNR